MNRGMWILLCVCLVGWAMLGSGIALLVVRHQQDAPQWYKDASILYDGRPSSAKVNVRVAKADEKIVTKRIARHIKTNGGDITTQYSTDLSALVSPGVAQSVRALHWNKRGLSPDYRTWPDWVPETADPHGAKPVKLVVNVYGVRYRQLVLDVGITATIIGGLAVIITTAGLVIAYAMQKEEQRSVATAANRSDTSANRGDDES